MATLFVTVGTTQFDELIDVIDSDAFATAAAERGVDRVTVQIGRGTRTPDPAHEIGADAWVYIRCGVAYDVYRMKRDIGPDLMCANLVICHAGEGMTAVTWRDSKFDRVWWGEPWCGYRFGLQFYQTPMM